jgi:predicted metalloprotease with PDZ domain
MAADIDDRIQKQTQGKKSLRDAFQYLLQRNQVSATPFKTDELARMISDATGADVREIFDRWMSPNPIPKQP